MKIQADFRGIRNNRWTATADVVPQDLQIPDFRVDGQKHQPQLLQTSIGMSCLFVDIRGQQPARSGPSSPLLTGHLNACSTSEPV